ncbi:MAG: group I truncated hemoglobin [Methylococcaceae bacterium]
MTTDNQEPEETQAAPEIEPPATPQPAKTAEDSLHEKLGGDAAIDAAVDILCRKLSTDARINYFFFGISAADMANRQRTFLTTALGCGGDEGATHLRKDHAPQVAMGLNDRHFDVILALLGATLSDMEIAEELIAEITAAAASNRGAILGR